MAQETLFKFKKIKDYRLISYHTSKLPQHRQIETESGKDS